MAPVMNRQDSRARAEHAFRLRACGRTWAEIATECEYRSRQSAQQAVDRLLASRPTDPATERATSTETLRVLQAALFGRFAAAAQGGDDRSLLGLSKELRSLVAENARINGLYAPVRHEHDVSVHESATAILDRAEADLLALAKSNVIDAEVVQ